MLITDESESVVYPHFKFTWRLILPALVVIKFLQREESFVLSDRDVQDLDLLIAYSSWLAVSPKLGRTNPSQSLDATTIYGSGYSIRGIPWPLDQCLVEW